MDGIELVVRYHRLLRQLVARGSRGEAWLVDLRQILQWLDDDCRRLPAAEGTLLRSKLAREIESELQHCTDTARVVLSIVLKHLKA